MAQYIVQAKETCWILIFIGGPRLKTYVTPLKG